MTPIDDGILGTMPDTELAARFGVGVDAVRKRRKKLGVARHEPPRRSCVVCGELARTKVSLCHTHHERWRRWGKPPLAEWVAAFREKRLNTCAVCGKRWNGHFRCRHCSPECLTEHKRESALAHWHARTPGSKEAARKRQMERLRARSEDRKVPKRCVICGEEFSAHPHIILCGKLECKSKNTTRHTRAHRGQQAGIELGVVAAEVHRRLDQ